MLLPLPSPPLPSPLHSPYLSPHNIRCSLLCIRACPPAQALPGVDDPSALAKPTAMALNWNTKLGTGSKGTAGYITAGLKI